MSGVVRVQVLMQEAEARRFEAYCLDRGHKKSTLIARLVREHLDRESLETQPMPVERRAVG
jgi:hypothetical protein